MSAAKKRKITVEDIAAPPLSDQTDYEDKVPLGSANGKFKILSFNVAGMKARVDKPHVLKYLRAEDADVVALQETKTQTTNETLYSQSLSPAYKHVYFNSAKSSKGHHGVAMYSKTKPLNVLHGVGVAEHDQEGRVLTLEFNKIFIVNAYIPNSGMKLDRLPYRAKYDDAFRAFIRELDAKKPVIIVGDLNVAHTPRDLANNKKRYNKVPGATQQERDSFSTLLNEAALVDVWRAQNAEAIHFTFWSMRFASARLQNNGWRLDYVLASKRVASELGDVFLRTSKHGSGFSDHVPMGVVADTSLIH